VVKKFTGDRALERGLNDMAKNGYVVDQQASRKALYSAATGLFTRKQIHTVTFRKRESPVPTPQAGAARAASAAPSVDLIDQLERLGRLRDSSVLSTDEFEAQKAALLVGASPGPAAPAEPFGTYDVVVAGLTPGARKIQAIKVVRDVGGLGLASAKQIVENAGGEPTVLRSDIELVEADSLKSSLESVGVVVEIRPVTPTV